MSGIPQILLCASCDEKTRLSLGCFLKELHGRLASPYPSRRKEMEILSQEGGPFTIVDCEDFEEDLFPSCLVGEPRAINDELNELAPKNPHGWIPVLLVLPRQGEWSTSLEKVMGHPQVSLEGVFRGSHLMELADWEERARFEAALLRVLRGTLEAERGEKFLRKPINWKANISSKETGFFSFFADPATRELLGDIKFALRDIRSRLNKTLPSERRGKGVHPFLKLHDNPVDFTKTDKETNPELKKICRVGDWNPERFRIPAVLLLGESGTGKTLVAKWIAQALFYEILGEGKSLPFHRMNMGAIGKELVDSELFGNMKGAYTGADKFRPGIFLSHRGWVVFLDEIGDMLPEHQTRLLAYMDSGQVRPQGYDGELPVAPVIVVAATNKPVERLVLEGTGAFRQDLLYRFDHVLRLPPLRERKEDLRLLISLALQDEEVNPSVDNNRREVEHITLRAIHYLEGQSYPGNFRQLRGMLAQGVRSAQKEGGSILCRYHFDKL